MTHEEAARKTRGRKTIFKEYQIGYELFIKKTLSIIIIK
jgi:hypothetical protein